MENNLLPLEIEGMTRSYKKNGRMLGYPTANIPVDTELPDGIYFGTATLLNYKNRPSLIFLGVPHLKGDSERRLEVHILGIPDVDYYNQRLAVSIQIFHRNNKAFPSITVLQKAISEDEVQARNWFRNKTNL